MSYLIIRFIFQLFLPTDSTATVPSDNHSPFRLYQCTRISTVQLVALRTHPVVSVSRIKILVNMNISRIRFYENIKNIDKILMNFFYKNIDY